jgi:hypothetical protein
MQVFGPAFFVSGARVSTVLGKFNCTVRGFSGRMRDKENTDERT